MTEIAEGMSFYHDGPSTVLVRYVEGELQWRQDSESVASATVSDEMLADVEVNTADEVKFATEKEFLQMPLEVCKQAHPSRGPRREI